MTIVYEYNQDGEIINYEINDYFIQNIPRIFRKYSENRVEFEICKLLKENPHPKCVNIYKIFGSYIDMEYVNTISIYKKNIHYDQIFSDVERAIEYLNKNNIVYIDIKLDNIGYNLKDKIYKIFDFNMSGIVDKLDNYKWLFKPDSGYLYRKYYENNKRENVNLFDIDRYALEYFKKTDLK